jgi:hypothetical protein
MSFQYKYNITQDEKNNLRQKLFEFLDELNKKYGDKIENKINHTEKDMSYVKKYKHEYYLKNKDKYRLRNKELNKKWNSLNNKKQTEKRKLARLQI